MHIRDVYNLVVSGHTHLTGNRVRLITEVSAYLNAPYRVSYYRWGYIVVEYCPQGYKNAWRLKDVDWRY
jgi:hypothetical protein